MPRRSNRHVIDPAILQDIMGGTATDPRTWVAYGTVELDQDTDEGRSVTFDEALGPIVEVRVHPHDRVISCRVAGALAGQHEGTWEPFVGGDEVLVVCPEGSSIGPPCIIGRLNNAIDRFPRKVAGKDTDQNNLSFRRMRSPHVTETASMFMIRSAVTGAMIGIDEAGNLTLRDGESTGLQFGPSGFAVQDADGTGQVVLNTEEGYASIWWGATLVKCDGVNVNIAASGNVAIGSAGNIPILHALSTEQALNLALGYLQSLTAALVAMGAVPLTGASLALVIDPLLAGLTHVLVGIGTANTNAHPSLGAVVGTVNTAFQTPMPVSPLTPGIGCPGLVIG
jgi:hypothetical protein